MKILLRNISIAEGTGFEPVRACTLLAFQASALDHYANLLSGTNSTSLLTICNNS